MNDDVREMAAVCFMYRHDPRRRTVLLKSDNRITESVVCIGCTLPRFKTSNGVQLH